MLTYWVSPPRLGSETGNSIVALEGEHGAQALGYNAAFVSVELEIDAAMRQFVRRQLLPPHECRPD